MPGDHIFGSDEVGLPELLIKGSGIYACNLTPRIASEHCKALNTFSGWIGMLARQAELYAALDLDMSERQAEATTEMNSDFGNDHPECQNVRGALAATGASSIR